MTPTFVWLTCTNDGGSALQSILSVLNLGASPSDCHVVQTRDRELHEHHRRIIEDLGIEIITSSYRRSDTKPCFKALFAVLCRIARDNNSDYIVQLDSDTLLTRLDSIQEAIEDNVPAMAGTWPTVPFAGCAWLCRADALFAIAKEITGPMWDDIPWSMPDDTLTGQALDRVYGRENIRRHSIRPSGGYVGSWHYRNEKRELCDLAAFDVVTFGNRGLIDWKGRALRDVVAETMLQFRKILISASSPTPASASPEGAHKS